MLTGNLLTQHLAREFTPPQAALLSEVITSAYADLVKTSDFNELKEIVRDLAEAQQRTEQTMGHLSQRVDRLAEAQERTEQTVGHLSQRVDRLAEAQERTEQTVNRLSQRMDTLAQAQERTEEALQLLARGLSETRSEVAGLGRQFGYALENEAYRALPAFLRQRHNIELTRRFVRTYVGEQEINLLAEGQQNGTAVLLVGEAKAHLGTEDFAQLETSVEAVRQAQEAGELPAGRIIPLLVTHMARPTALRRAESEGIIVVQSFEW